MKLYKSQDVGTSYQPSTTVYKKPKSSSMNSLSPLLILLQLAMLNAMLSAPPDYAAGLLESIYKNPINNKSESSQLNSNYSSQKSNIEEHAAGIKLMYKTTFRPYQMKNRYRVPPDL